MTTDVVTEGLVIRVRGLLVLCHGNSDKFVQGTILEPSTSHIGREVALVAWATALVYLYIYARISQIAEIKTTSFSVTSSKG